MANATKLWEVLVPTLTKTKKPIRTKHHKNWDDYVRKIAGGLTILKPGRGQWVDAGELYEERVIPVRVACTEKQINKIIDFTIKHYDQIAVMAYLVSEKVIIKRENNET